ncbi:MAG: hypothetical protein KJ970_09265 [Candidatus Eisenbacteria bacterium]|uniref:Dipeptidylpeptidase IV N-terminal domain-containing protein n=1 Tax=Eiseniibacteriota bacterium TaxID=2212470 RepID=A0A948RXX5_UNCEI|nr:hypothetical protein [Candidatus Eisenbacteria bacterium]MBU2691107.1 hypothetical protein [Candidatus Eisenbacteria bacterium]
MNEFRVIDPTPGSTSAFLWRHEEYHISTYSWSPAGNQIVYMAYDPEPDQWEQRKAYIVSPTVGMPEELLPEGWFPTRVAWSPDGNQICFDSQQDGSYNLWIVSRTGENPTQLTIDPADDAQPAWSPDGSQIAFSSNRSGSYDIWVVSATGENPTRMTFGEDAEVSPQWSPDGRAISFSGAVPSGFAWKYDIWVLYLE